MWYNKNKKDGDKMKRINDIDVCKTIEGRVAIKRCLRELAEDPYCTYTMLRQLAKEIGYSYCTLLGIIPHTNDKSKREA